MCSLKSILLFVINMHLDIIEAELLRLFAGIKDILVFSSFKDKFFLYLVNRHKKEKEATKFLFPGGKRDQGIKDITRNISKLKMTLLKTFYKPFLFKLIECMDTICVVRFIHYISIMGLSCFKPLFFCVC